MNIFIPEHSKFAYCVDFFFYGLIVAVLAGMLVWLAPAEQGLVLSAYSLLGLLGWTVIEYGLHRFVLHALHPFRRWHAEHHRRPAALIRTPMILSATLIFLLVFLPALFFSQLWRAWALSVGLLTGYFVYTVVHHAIHHWRFNNAWLKRRQYWHGLHHDSEQPGRYGVTSALWDYVFASTAKQGK
ncbi:sterol desaturase family protein [soil metagenome]